MRINPVVYGVVVTVVFFGIIGGFQAAGMWSTSGKVDASGQSIQPEADDVNSIKGWMTLDQISSAYNVPLADLLQTFNLPVDTDPQTPIKDLESDSFSVTELRTWLLNRVNPPAPAAEAPVLNTPVITIVPTVASTDVPMQDSPTPSATEHTVEVGTITGKTTYQELIDWGLPQATIEGIIGGPMPGGGMAVKDDVAAKGLAFSDIKTTLQTALDQLK